MEGTEEGTAWYKMAQDASRHFYNTLMFQKCVGVCSGELEIGGEGAGGAWSRRRNIAGNSNRMNEMALTLLH